MLRQIACDKDAWRFVIVFVECTVEVFEICQVGFEVVFIEINSFAYRHILNFVIENVIIGV